MSIRRILIVGGGVGGPVLALLLKRAGMEPLVFEQAPSERNDGAGLGIAPNGMRMLAAAGLESQVRAVSVKSHQYIFQNSHGRALAVIPAGEASRYGCSGVIISRSLLNRVLLERLTQERVPVHYGKRAVDLTQTSAGVTLHFADGSAVEGDIAVGADGIRSQVRKAIMPEAPEPAYTGMMAPGGFSPCMRNGSYGPGAPQNTHFIFGRNGFFGHADILTPEGPRTMWWSTAAAPLPSRDQLAAPRKEELQSKLLHLHGDWAPPVPQLIQTAEGAILNVAIHDVPALPRWSSGRAVLLGDAAHAVAPHSGQGASMALEDAVVLARLLLHGKRDDPQSAFAAYERERRPRTDRVIAVGRRNAQRKMTMSPLAYWIQQQMMRLFIPLSARRGNDWLWTYGTQEPCSQRSE